MRDGLALLKANSIDFRVLMDLCGAIATVRRNDQRFEPITLLAIRMPFCVTRSQPPLTRLNPDLQEVQRLRVAWIELAMGHPSTGAHQLNLPWLKDAAIAHAVLVLQGTFEHVAEDLHVAMRDRKSTRLNSSHIPLS